jgi:hypothetical protein
VRGEKKGTVKGWDRLRFGDSSASHRHSSFSAFHAVVLSGHANDQDTALRGESQSCSHALGHKMADLELFWYESRVAWRRRE